MQKAMPFWTGAMNLAPQGEEHRMSAVLASTWPPHPDPHAVRQTRRVTRSLANALAVGFADHREGDAHPYFLTLYAYSKIELPSCSEKQVTKNEI
jgi:hypothetical protein